MRAGGAASAPCSLVPVTPGAPDMRAAFHRLMRESFHLSDDDYLMWRETYDAPGRNRPVCS